MPPYKEPSFQDRTALAAKAKQAALDKLRAKPPLDEAELTLRREAAERREVAQRLARQDKLAVREAAKAKKIDDDAANLVVADDVAVAEPAVDTGVTAMPAAETQAPVPKLSPEEQKAIRDAKYAARKSRVGRR